MMIVLISDNVYCMYPLHKKHYCERWGEQTCLFFRVRW
jgi:hypothetical protein